MVFHLALVTGASSGIGKAVCELLAEKGIGLIATGRDLEQLNFLKESLSSKVPIQIFSIDLETREGRRQLIEIIHQNKLDLVINNAGFGLYGDALNYSTKEQLAVLEVNGNALLELTLEAARSMTQRKIKGVILNVSSAAAFQILPKMAVYAASKAFVHHVSEALDFELKDQGVRVLTLCPGIVETSFQKRAGQKNWKKEIGKEMTPSFVAKEMWKQIEQLKPLKIIDWRYRLLTLISYLLPKSLIASIEGTIIEERIKP